MPRPPLVALATVAMLASAAPAGAASFLIDATTASPANRQGFDPSRDRYLLDLRDFPVEGPLAFFSGAAGEPGIAGTAADDPTAIASSVNLIVLQNFDDNDDGVTAPANGVGFPANWDNSFNARAAAGAIAANTTGDRPGFFLYWNEGLGVNRLAYSENLASAAAGLAILFANDAPGSPLGADLTTAGGSPTLGADRMAANAAFADLASFSADNFDVAPPVPLPAGLPLLLAGLAGLGVMARARRRTA
ncbi:MAG: VPLPA-CTERM sorting domain-containing protein [Paracoccaceae bacterium]